MTVQASIYVVTAGSYSDYHIKRVFLNRDNAERFASYHADYNVEEWKAADNDPLEQIRYVEIDYRVTKDGWNSCEIYQGSTSTIEGNPESIEGWTYFYRDDKGTDLLRLARVIPTHVTDDIEERYRRICDDIYAEIRSLIEVERWTGEMIDEWLADKGHL